MSDPRLSPLTCGDRKPQALTSWPMTGPEFWAPILPRGQAVPKGSLLQPPVSRVIVTFQPLLDLGPAVGPWVGASYQLCLGSGQQP